MSNGHFNNMTIYGEFRLRDCTCWAETGYGAVDFWVEPSDPKIGASVRCIKDTRVMKKLMWLFLATRVSRLQPKSQITFQTKVLSLGMHSMEMPPTQFLLMGTVRFFPLVMGKTDLATQKVHWPLSIQSHQ